MNIIFHIYQQSAETLRPNTSSGVDKIKGDEKDPTTCMRCKVSRFSISSSIYLCFHPG